MVELFVVAMCFGDYACSDALKAYKSYNPNVRMYERNARDLAYKYATKEAVVTIGAYGAAITNRKIRLRIVQGVTLTGNQDEAILQWRYEF